MVERAGGLPVCWWVGDIQMATTVFFSDIKALIEAMRFQDASKKLVSFVEKNPDDAMGYTYMGMAQEGLGNTQKSGDAFQQAYKLNTSFENLQKFVRCMITLGRLDDAQTAFKDPPRSVTNHRNFAAFYLSCAALLGVWDKAAAFAIAQDTTDIENQSELAHLMVAAGDYHNAAILLEKLTAQKGAPAALLANLGMVFSQLDRDDEAISVLSQALEQEPDNPLHLNTLAQHQRKMGQTEAAEASLIRALAMDGSSARYLYALGSLYQSSGRFLEAADCFRETTRLVPEQVKAHHSLGATLQIMQRHESAVTAFEAALEQNPEHAPSHNSMGVSLKKNSQLKQAIQSYRSAIKADPNMREAYNNLANALRDHNAYDEAAETISQALALWPRYGEIYNTRGVVEQQTGNKNKAITSFRRAIELNSKLSKAYHNLAMAQKVTADDPMVPVLTARAIDQTLPESDRVNYNFALGKVMGDLKCYSESFQAIERANLIRKTELEYDVSGDQMLFDAIKTFFSNPGSIAKVMQRTQAAKRPVFVLGMPRSGTSLTEQIISSHSEVYGCGELEFLNRPLKKMHWQGKSAQTANYDDLSQHYLASIEDLGFKEAIFVDKMPLNFRWIGWILKAFPDAKIVHMVRNPMAVCWSNYQRSFRADGMAFTFDQEDMGTYYAMYQDLMAFWHKVFPGQIFDFVYEDLTNDQEVQSRRLCAYLGLTWEDRLLSFQDNKRAVRTASSAQVREKIYQGSSDEWRNFEAMLGPMKEKLNS